MQAKKNTHRNTPTIKLDQYENNWWIRGRFLILIFFEISLNSRSKLLLITVFTSLKEDASELCSWARCTGPLPSAASWGKPVRRPAASSAARGPAPTGPYTAPTTARKGRAGRSLGPPPAGGGTGSEENGVRGRPPRAKRAAACHRQLVIRPR